jgi:hypothetical protein
MGTGRRMQASKAEKHLPPSTHTRAIAQLQLVLKVFFVWPTLLYLLPQCFNDIDMHLKRHAAFFDSVGRLDGLPGGARLHVLQLVFSRWLGVRVANPCRRGGLAPGLECSSLGACALHRGMCPQHWHVLRGMCPLPWHVDVNVPSTLACAPHLQVIKA